MSSELLDIPKSFTEQLSALLDAAEHIALVTHTNPDGDALGSLLALYIAFSERYPAKHVYPIGSDSHAVPRYLQFLPKAEQVLAPQKAHVKPDLLIVLDAPNVERLHKAETFWRSSKKVVVIDHHEPEKPFADLSLILPKAAATGVILLALLEKLSLEITRDIATCLYCAIMTDTGRFQFQNTNACVFASAEKLLLKGANPSDIASHVYEQDSYAQLKLRARVLERLQYTDDARIAYSYITTSDFDELKATKDDLASFVDDVRTLEGICVAVFFRELDNNNGIRVNLRAKNTADVSKVAREFGGGGHKAAAGFTLKETLATTIEKTVTALEMVLDS